MAPVIQSQIEDGNQPAVATATFWPAWINQASRRHCHFGLKSAPHHRDFRPEMEEVK